VDFGAVTEMAANLQVQGQLYPILVRRHGERYQVADGETRLRALAYNAKQAGTPGTVRVVLRDYSDQQMALVAFSSVYFRKDLNPIEEARGLRRLHDELGVTYEVLADFLGKTKSYLIERVRLLNLDARLQAMLEASQLTPGQAVALGRLEGPELLPLAEKAASAQLPVARIRALIREVPGFLPGRVPLTPDALEVAVSAGPKKPAASRKEQREGFELKDELDGIWKYLTSSQRQLLLIHARRMIEKVEALE
jgi:ParB family chromosome partitioning protein